MRLNVCWASLRFARLEVGAPELHEDRVDGHRAVRALRQVLEGADRLIVLATARLGFCKAKPGRLAVQAVVTRLGNHILVHLRRLGGVAERHLRGRLEVAREYAGVSRRIGVGGGLEEREGCLRSVGLGQETRAGAGCARSDWRPDARVGHGHRVSQHRVGSPLDPLAPGEIADRNRADDDDRDHSDGHLAPAALDHFARLPGPGLELVFLQVTPFGSFHILRPPV